MSSEAPTDIRDEIRSSAEQLALADQQWSALQRQGQERARQLERLMQNGVTHVDCLFRGDMPADAFATSLILLMPPIIDNATKKNQGNYVALLSLAYMSLMQLMQQMTDDGHTRTHIHTIARYLCSLLYAAYKKAVTSPDDYPEASQWMPVARNILADAIKAGLVQYPVVDVNGDNVSIEEGTATEYGRVVGDLIGRARALNLLQD